MNEPPEPPELLPLAPYPEPGELITLDAITTPTRLELALDIVRTIAHVVGAVALVVIAS